jgi:hypothetical protein
MKGLLSDGWDGFKDLTGGLFDAIRTVDPELQAQRDREAQELYNARADSPFFQAFGWGEGNNERTEDFSFGNVAKDIGELYRGGATAVTNPKQTSNAVADLAFGGVLTLTPVGDMGVMQGVGQDQRAMAKQFGAHVKQTYGSFEGFVDYAKKNPASAMLDLVGVGFVAKKAIDVATNPLVQQRFMAELDGIVSAANQTPYMANIVYPDRQFVSGQPVGSGKGKRTPTQDARVEELKQIVTQVENSDIVAQPPKSVQGMEGEIVMFTMADRARAGGTAKKIITASDEYDIDVGQYGGVLFGQMLEAIKMGDAWASDRIPLTSIEQRIREINQLHDVTPQMSQFLLKPTGIGFSHQIAQTMLSALKPKLNAKERKILDEKLRHVAPNWPGIDTDLETAMRAINGAEGQRISFILASNADNNITHKMFKDYKGKDQTGYGNQVPSFAEAMVANTQPQLLGARHGTTPMITTLDKNPNTRLSDVDPSSVNSEGIGILHPSYNTTFKSDGEPTRPMQEDLTIFDFMEAREATNGIGFTGRDFVTPQKIDPDNVTDAQYYATLRNDPPYVQVTDKLLKHLDDQGKLERKGLLSGL